MRKTLLSILLTLAFFGSAWGEVSVAPYLKRIPGYAAKQQEEIVKLGDRKELGSYPATVLDEFILKSYSRWEIAPTGEGVPVEMEVYELTDPPGAFGLYSLWDRTGHPQLSSRLNLPIEHRYAGQDLIFWRSSYFLHLRQPDAASQKEKVEQFVRSLLDAIPAANVLPVAIAHLPVDELRGESVEFYLGKNGLGLNPDFPKPLVPVMGLQDHIEIGFGRYKPNDTPLFLIAYPTPGVAQKYSVKIQDALSEYFGPGIYLKKSGPLIGMVLGSETEATRLLARLNYKAKVKWIEETPKDEGAETRTFLGTVTRALIGTLVFLLITGSMGIVVGYFRYLFIRSHPDWKGKDEMIRLKLDGR